MLVKELSSETNRSKEFSSPLREATPKCAKRQCIRVDDNKHFCQDREKDSDGPMRTLRLEYWGRSHECLQRKWAHMEAIDKSFDSREELILATTLSNEESVLERNMFPYDTPSGIEHWTLWSRHEMKEIEIEQFVWNWLRKNALQVDSWNYDENMSRSIDIFHVHVYLLRPVLQS
ncbi:uncharacterized protein PHALS_10983 [Plasmopara halstedii]|uniref:Uncharacterized protein n=1 Tax=Plasmopara halstedii TaxID=4781 RepID=A0A0P1AIQ1_PLAHL|nr:uncharacterized protein PHALS_10983 [Plasmopara halstedii]CEG40800.1 hypothetical protein PHALS_10983 [Plasmopara halstedii]|eukprot:XP_024577169.1 hypothetical protein PHALS_10983 [Plasmopara halstedii]